MVSRLPRIVRWSSPSSLVSPAAGSAVEGTPPSAAASSPCARSLDGSPWEPDADRELLAYLPRKKPNPASGVRSRNARDFRGVAASAADLVGVVDPLRGGESLSATDGDVTATVGNPSGSPATFCSDGAVTELVGGAEGSEDAVSIGDRSDASDPDDDATEKRCPLRTCAVSPQDRVQSNARDRYSRTRASLGSSQRQQQVLQIRQRVPHIQGAQISLGHKLADLR